MEVPRAIPSAARTPWRQVRGLSCADARVTAWPACVRSPRRAQAGSVRWRRYGRRRTTTTLCSTWPVCRLAALAFPAAGPGGQAATLCHTQGPSVCRNSHTRRGKAFSAAVLLQQSCLLLCEGTFVARYSYPWHGNVSSEWRKCLLRTKRGRTLEPLTCHRARKVRVPRTAVNRLSPLARFFPVSR